jgi:hypothetical protein
MISNPGRGGRAFSFRPTPASDKLGAPSDPSQSFIRLFSVTITHTYYTQQKGRCADFRIVPTDTTATLMASLGLVLKNEGTGFSVFCTPASLDGIFAYLLREAQNPAERTGFWSRLTFLMELVNPSFVGITALPINIKVAEQNLFGCNTEAHDDGPRILLPEGDFMGADALHSTIGSEYNMRLPKAAARVTVSDISGAVVIPTPGGEDIVLFDVGDAKYAIIEFGGLPYDLYTVNVFGKAGQPLAGEPFSPRSVLYVPTGTETFGLLDMLFTEPIPGEGGKYPIPPMFEKDPDPKNCGHIAYQLPFDARHTYWEYYVAPQVPGELVDITIEGPGATFESEGKVWLPDGSHADKFTSRDPLAMRQKSAQRFQLKGRRLDPNGQSNAVRLLRLPVAPVAPVWPAPKDRPSAPNTTGTSEMFVYV